MNACIEAFLHRNVEIEAFKEPTRLWIPRIGFWRFMQGPIISFNLLENCSVYVCELLLKQVHYTNTSNIRNSPEHILMSQRVVCSSLAS